MKALAQKRTSEKPKRQSNTASRHSVQRPPYLPSWAINNLSMHRKSICACDCGCPSYLANTCGNDVSQPNDPAEIDADEISGSVTRMANDAWAPDGVRTAPPFQSIQPQKASSWSDAPVSGEIVNRIQSSRSGGSGLNANTRAFFEPRFGADLEGGRIHTGVRAAKLSRDLNAKAFTLGCDKFFGTGQFRPETESGKYLIAHELSHVRQGDLAIRRCADEADEAKYDVIIGEIKELGANKNLDSAPKTKADTIIKEGKGKPNCIYYARKLKLLFTMPVKSSKQVATEIRKRTTTAVKAEEKRLETKEAKKILNIEKETTADPEPAEAPVAVSEKNSDTQPEAPKILFGWFR